MGGAHVGDDADVGPGHRSDGLNLMQAAHAHLDHHGLGVERAAQHGEGAADGGVEVAARGVGLELAGKDGRAHLLGRGLARRAGNAHDHATQLVAPPRGQVGQGPLAAAAHKKRGLVLAGARKLGCAGLAGHHAGGGTCREGLLNVVVAIDPLAHKGHEQVGLPHLARVDGHVAHKRGRLGALYDTRTDDLGHLARRCLEHRGSPFVPAFGRRLSTRVESGACPAPPA